MLSIWNSTILTRCGKTTIAMKLSIRGLATNDGPLKKWPIDHTMISDSRLVGKTRVSSRGQGNAKDHR